MLNLTLPEKHGVEDQADRALLIKLAILLLICIFPPVGHTQQPRLDPVSARSLPDAPELSPQEQNNGDTSVAQASSAISGTLLDANGGTLANVRVTLTYAKDAAERTSLSGSGGEFSFRDLPAGNFKLTVTAQGMEPFVLPDIMLRENEVRQLPPISMAIASTTTEVQVVVTQTALAQEQVKAAEHQRVFGVLPNFYSSYIWNAAPLNPRQKFDLAFHSLTDPIEFVGTGVIAGAEQANNTFSGYGQGAEGYAKRYGAAYADDVLGKLIGSAILPSLIHQDPRYFYKGSGSVRSRVFYAISRALVTRGDNGQAQPNYSGLLGSIAAGGLANLYYPRSDRGLGLTLGDASVGIAGRAADNLIREFLLRRLTPNIPDYEKGKP